MRALLAVPLIVLGCGVANRIPARDYVAQADEGRKISSVKDWEFEWHADGSATVTNPSHSIMVVVWAEKLGDLGADPHAEAERHLAEKGLFLTKLKVPTEGDDGGAIHCGSKESAKGGITAVCLRIDPQAIKTGVLVQAVEVASTREDFDDTGQLHLPADILRSAIGFRPKSGV